MVTTMSVRLYGREERNEMKSIIIRVLSLGLVDLINFWRDARLKGELKNAKLDAKSTSQSGTARKSRSKRISG